MDTDRHGFLSCKDAPIWLVERTTGPPLFMRQACAIWFESSSCRNSAAGCRRERPSWPFHPDL